MDSASDLSIMYEAGISYAAFKLSCQGSTPKAIHCAWTRCKKEPRHVPCDYVVVMKKTAPDAGTVSAAKARIRNEIEEGTVRRLFVHRATLICKELGILDPHRKLIVLRLMK